MTYTCTNCGRPLARHEKGEIRAAGYCPGEGSQSCLRAQFARRDETIAELRAACEERGAEIARMQRTKEQHRCETIAALVDALQLARRYMMSHSPACLASEVEYLDAVLAKVRP